MQRNGYHPAVRFLKKARALRHRFPWGCEAGLQKYEIVNALVMKNGYESYLEICTTETGGRFWRIDRKRLRVCHRLLYRCPEEFADGEEITFRSAGDSIENLLDAGLKYDIVFLDSWHTFDCSMRDLETGLSVLREGGVMVVHDCFPRKEHAGPVFHGGCWSGVTYCAYVDFLLSRRDLYHCTVETDYGCGVVKKIRRDEAWKSPHRAADEIVEQWRSKRSRDDDMYDFFYDHRRELLNLVSAEEFLAMENLQAPLPVRLTQLFRRFHAQSSPAGAGSVQALPAA
jgi:hypothetical protein